MESTQFDGIYKVTIEDKNHKRVYPRVLMRGWREWEAPEYGDRSGVVLAEFRLEGTILPDLDGNLGTISWKKQEQKQLPEDSPEWL